jgi:hypothetical protein
MRCFGARPPARPAASRHSPGRTASPAGSCTGPELVIWRAVVMAVGATGNTTSTSTSLRPACGRVGQGRTGQGGKAHADRTRRGEAHAGRLRGSSRGSERLEDWWRGGRQDTSALMARMLRRGFILSQVSSSKRPRLPAVQRAHVGSRGCWYRYTGGSAPVRPAADPHLPQHGLHLAHDRGNHARLGAQDELQPLRGGLGERVADLGAPSEGRRPSFPIWQVHDRCTTPRPALESWASG